MRVSVITPVYNRADYIAEVLDSILSQDYSELELIVLDDGSTDDSLAVIKRYEARARIETHPNMGETRTVNRGFSLATGDVIGVVNSDDPLLPGMVRAAVDALAADPALMVVYPDWKLIDAKGAEMRTVETHAYSYADMLRWHHCLPGPGAFFRRRVVEALGGRDETFRYVADFDFWLRAGLIGPFARIPRPLATFRHHETSATVAEKGKRMADEHLTLIEKLYARADLPEAVRSLKREAFSSACFIAGVTAGENAPEVRRQYFLDALRWCPEKYLGEYRPRLQHIVPCFPRVDSVVRTLKRLTGRAA
jgi:glycosyltransferase involved in cell wall biosynthesis